MGVNIREKDKGSGIWWVFINQNGKRKSKKIGRDKKLANEVAEKIKAKLVLGDFDIEKQKVKLPSFKDYSNNWLETYIKTLRRESTYNRYSYIMKKYVYPAFGNKILDDITRSEIKDLMLTLYSKGLSKSSIRLVRDVISGSMCSALDDELIQSNPVSGVLKRLNIGRKKELTIEPLTHEEIELFFDICTKYRNEHYAFFLCAFRTGMRLGELLALKWSDIDWNKKFIRVKRSYRKGKVTPTKTGKTRAVDISDQLYSTLKNLLTVRKQEALKEGNSAPFELIFHRNNKHMKQNYIRRIYKWILNKAGIREMRVHDIRHTFASLLLSNGESPVYVKEQLGHSSIQITVDIYGHLIPSSNRDAVNKLDTMQLFAPHMHPSKDSQLQYVEIATNY